MDVNALLLVLLSFTPTIEGRYALPLAVSLGYDPLLSYIIATATTVLLAFILGHTLWVLDRIVRKLPYVSELWARYVDGTRKKVKPYVERYGAIGLTLFVATPLPGTGVWTGSIAGYVLGIPPRKLAVYTAIGGIIANTITFLSILGIHGLI